MRQNVTANKRVVTTPKVAKSAAVPKPNRIFAENIGHGLGNDRHNNGSGRNGAGTGARDHLGEPCHGHSGILCRLVFRPAGKGVFSLDEPFQRCEIIYLLRPDTTDRFLVEESPSVASASGKTARKGHPLLPPLHAQRLRSRRSRTWRTAARRTDRNFPPVL